MNLTIIDIARLSGFSKSTVSRVLTGDPNVKAETRERIRVLMEEHHYKRNEIARCMVKGNIHIVLIIVGDIANFFYGRSVSEIENILYEAGYMAVVCNSEYNSQKELDFLNMAMEFKFAGVILMTASESPELCRLLAELECPVVLMNRYLRNMPNMDYVIQNNYLGAYEAVSCLIKMGHRRIFHLAGVFGSSTADDRMRGYQKAMEDAGYQVTPDMIMEGNLKWKLGYQYAKRLIEEATDATALFIANDTMTLGFISGWTEGGRCIPDDMSILCFDYTPLMDQMAVKISTVGVDAGELGSLTAKLLLERISGSDIPPQNIVCQPHLRVKSSVKRY